MCFWNFHCTFFFFTLGVSDVDYSLYPGRELQDQWLRSYLEAYKEYKGFGTEVTEKEVEILFIQVNQFALVSLNFNKRFFIWFNNCLNFHLIKQFSFCFEFCEFLFKIMTKYDSLQFFHYSIFADQDFVLFTTIFPIPRTIVPGYLISAQ